MRFIPPSQNQIGIDWDPVFNGEREAKKAELLDGKRRTEVQWI